MLLSALLGLVGAGSLVYGLWARGKKPLWANWFMLAGVILFCGGALFGVAAWGFQVVPSERPQQLAAINHATQAPQDIAPAPLQPTDFVEVWDAWPTPTPESLPDYPIPEPPEHLNQGADGNEPDSSAMTRILIPAMGLDTVVKYVPFDSSTWLIGGLKQEVAWMGDTSWPGLGSNTGLAGHVDLANGDSGPFWNLGDLKIRRPCLGFYRAQPVHLPGARVAHRPRLGSERNRAFRKAAIDPDHLHWLGC